MNQKSFRTQIELIGCVSFAAMTVSILQAEPHCPGSIASERRVSFSAP